MLFSFTTRWIELILVQYLEEIITFLFVQFVVRFSKFKVCQKAYKEENTAIKRLESAALN